MATHRASEESREGVNTSQTGSKTGRVEPESRVARIEVPSVEMRAQGEKRARQDRAHEHARLASPRVGIAVPTASPSVTGPAARNISMSPVFSLQWRRNGENFSERERKNFALRKNPVGVR